MRPCLRCSTNRCCNWNALPYSMRPNWRTSQLCIDRQAVDRIECLSQRLVESGMRVDSGHQGLDSRFGLHGGDHFGDQLISRRTDAMNAKDLAVLLVGDHLDEPIVLADDGGLAVRDERKFADLDLAPLRPRLRLGHAYTADARLGVGRRRDAIAIQGLDGLAGDMRHRHHALARSYVR